MTLARPLSQERLAACGLPFLQAALHFLAEKLNNSAILTAEDGPPQVCPLRLELLPQMGITDSCEPCACHCLTRLALGSVHCRVD